MLAVLLLIPNKVEEDSDIMLFIVNNRQHTRVEKPTGVGAEVHGELTGVATGVRTDLTFEWPFVVVDSQVLLQTAAVRRCVRTVFAFVRLLACV